LAKRVLEKADPTTQWALDVIAGRILAGELVKAACERHLRDLKDGPSRGLHWDPESAAYAQGFFPAVLSITAGSHEGKPFNLLPWHMFVVGCLFGWKLTSGRLRFRRGWLETGKGQAKSPLMAGIGLLMMGWRGIARSQVFAIGQDRATANVLFADAAAMCRADIPGEDEGDSLVQRGEVIIRGEGDNAWKIEHPDSGSLFRALANGEAISGPRPAAVLADEIHEFKTNGPIETWQRAIAKMPGDALMLLGTNTPATTQLVGTAYSEFYQKVAKGEIQDDEAFAFIARVDKADRETVFDNPACWGKALPALGVTFPLENIQGEVNTARVLLSTAMSVKRLYFGIPTGSTDFWIDETAWAEVQAKVNPEEFKGCPCWASLDLSQKNDLTALTVIWLKNRKFYAKTWYWTTQAGLHDRALKDQAPYMEWAADPAVDLTAVPGAVIDKTFVAAELARIAAEHDLQFLAFDPAGIGDFIKACDDIGFPVWRWMGPKEPEGQGLKLVSHAQGTRVVFEDRQLCMPRSVEQLEDSILTKAIVIDASPVTYMCAGNALLISDGQKNRAFDKARSRGRIDGLVTIAMARGAAGYAAAPLDETIPDDYELKVWG
jgi:phage terminase large subunit-like protein